MIAGPPATSVDPEVVFEDLAAVIEETPVTMAESAGAHQECGAAIEEPAVLIVAGAVRALAIERAGMLAASGRGAEVG
jgi:hypothetical protein